MFVMFPDYTLPGEKANVEGVRTFSKAEALYFNQKGYGVFATPNKFIGRKLIKNLVEIRWAFFEIDDIPKSDQMVLIGISTLEPTRIVESKNSYHVYFRISDYCSVEDFSLIQNGLIDYFKSDKKIKNVNRLMRVPGFNNMKNPFDPFLVRTVKDSNLSYSVKQLKDAFPYTPSIKKEYITDISNESHSSLDRFLQSNCENSLRRLSGTPFVNYETYSFKNNANGRKNIYVNGKGSSCFISEDGLIGATHGPTVWQWLRYFKHSDSTIRRIIREVFDV